MTARIIDGKLIAERVRARVKTDADEFREMYRKYSRVGEERMRDYFRRAPRQETPES